MTGCRPVSQALFAIVGLVMRLAPIGAFGAMAFTMGRDWARYTAVARDADGAVSTPRACCSSLVVLGCHRRGSRASVSWKFLRYIGEEISDRARAPLHRKRCCRGMMAKMERLGCSEARGRPRHSPGYSFNLDGTSHLHDDGGGVSRAGNGHPALDFAAAGHSVDSDADLEGRGAVTGGGFITLAATLAATIPIPRLEALLIGVDRFMSEARAITNLIGNGVATVVVARWEGVLDLERLNRILEGGESDDAALLEAEGAKDKGNTGAQTRIDNASTHPSFCGPSGRFAVRADGRCAGAGPPRRRTSAPAFPRRPPNKRYNHPY